MSKSSLEPIMNRVVLKQLREEKVGKLLLAPEGQKSADRAIVIAVGPGILDMATGDFIPCTLKEGDQVLVNPYLGMRGVLDGEEIIIQKEEEILCKEVFQND